MNNVELKKLSEIISSLNNVLILTHENPDGDALGSAFALLRFFQEKDSKATLFLPEIVPAKYTEFVPGKDVVFSKLELKEKDIDAVVCLDCSDKKRLGMPEEFKEVFPVEKVINIDHHLDNELFGHINYIDSKASAAGEILYDIFNEIINCKFSKKLSDYLILAIVTDTGGLRFDNTTGKVFKKMSTLIDSGGDYLGIVKKMFFCKNYSLYMLESDIAINHLKWGYDRRFVSCYASDELLQKYNLTIKDIESLIDSFRVVEGVEISALITRRDDKFKISLRSNNEKYPVVGIAHKLNGGGHKLAAGCSIKSEYYEEVINTLSVLVGKLLEQ